MISPIVHAGRRRPTDALIYHDIFSGVYRLPFGAVKTGQQVLLRVFCAEHTSSAVLRLWYDGTELRLPMQNGGKLWEVVFPAPETACIVWYRFELMTDAGLRYCQPGTDPSCGTGSDFADDSRSFQLTVYDASFSVPSWAADSVFYQIFPDRFSRGEADLSDIGERKLHRDWNEPMEYLPDPVKGYYAADDFYGGNLRGIEEKLGYLKELGVTAIYLNPIFKAYSNHRYDTGDYTQIDPLLGTEADFRSLCDHARSLDIRIICDGVFSHTGSDSVYFNREGTYPTVGAYQSKDSPWYRWYRFKTYPTDYDCWWGVWSLPEVDETDPTYLDFIAGENGITSKWLHAGASGWRLDVADELPDPFLDELRRSVKCTDPEALILGEVWEDASNKVSYGALRRFLLGKQLDSVMNYPLRDLILRLVRGRCSGEEFCREAAILASNYPECALYASLNFLSTHDICRVTTLLGIDTDPDTFSREEQAAVRLTQEQRHHALTLHKAASMLQFVMPGMPCIYYGDELGTEGCKDPFNRAPFDWSKLNEPSEDTLADWYAGLGALRSAYTSLRRGSLSLWTEGKLVFVQRRLIHAAQTEENAEVLAVFNASDEPVTLPENFGRPLLISSKAIPGTLQPRGCAITVRK